MNYYEALETNWNTLKRDTGTRLRPGADLMELVERMHRALEATGPVGMRIPFMLQGLEFEVRTGMRMSRRSASQVIKNEWLFKKGLSKAHLLDAFDTLIQFATWLHTDGVDPSELYEISGDYVWSEDHGGWVKPEEMNA